MKKFITLKTACFCFLFLAAFYSLSNAQTFSSGTSFTSGTFSYDAANADFNCDGKPDMVCTNQTDNSVSVFLNTTTAGASTPTFSAKTDFTTGTTPYKISTADFNGDGKIDIVCTNLGSNTISVFFNTTTAGASTPTFSAKTDFATGIEPSAICIADFNGDGKTDIAVINKNESTISVFFNTTTSGASTPSFSSKTDFTSGTNPYGICTVDLNGDGKLDLACSNFGGNSISVLLNTTTSGSATPSFSAKSDFTAGSGAYSICFGDFNLDGKIDLACSNFNAASVSIFLNTTTVGASTPTFSAKSDLNTFIPNPAWIQASPINKDGRQDIIVGSTTSGTIVIFMDSTVSNSSFLSFSRTSISSGATQSSGGALADFNGDFKQDICCTDGSNSMWVMLNTSTFGNAAGAFASNITLTALTDVINVTLIDLNGDGRLDILASNANSPTIGIFMNTTTPGASSATFSSRIDLTSSQYPRVVSVADFNGDGKMDFAYCTWDANCMSVFLNTTTPGASTPTFAPRVDFTTVTHNIGTCSADINGDGKPDMIVANYGSNRVSVFLNTTTPGSLVPTFATRTDFTAGANPADICAVDLNGDGKPDIACADLGTTTMSVFINTTTTGASTPTFTAKTDITTGNSPNGINYTDINGDGKQDLVVSNTSSAFISVFMNTTTTGSLTPTFSRTDIGTVGGYSVSAGDFNGDGKPDIVVGNSAFGVYINTTPSGASTPTFSPRTTYPNGNPLNGNAIGDINLDGKIDLVSANRGGSVTVLLNNPVVAPVELSSFTSSVSANNVKLNWSTVMEENNSGFDVERKLSYENNWSKIANVNGYGTTNDIHNYTYEDKFLPSGNYKYRIKQIDFNGNFKYYDLANEVLIGAPNKYRLNQNYPNPFNPTTVLGFQIPVSGFISLKIYDVSGRVISELVNEIKQAGYYSVYFDAKNFPSGTYFYKLTGDNFSDTKKMVLVK